MGLHVTVPVGIAMLREDLSLVRFPETAGAYARCPCEVRRGLARGG